MLLIAENPDSYSSLCRHVVGWISNRLSEILKTTNRWATLMNQAEQVRSQGSKSQMMEFQVQRVEERKSKREGGGGGDRRKEGREGREGRGGQGGGVS